MNPFFIINTLPIMRGAIWAKSGKAASKPYNTAMFRGGVGRQAGTWPIRWKSNP